MSGCLLYPVKHTCFNNLIWTNETKAKNVSIQNEAWAKGWSDYKKDENNKISQLDYSKNFFWIKTWSKNHLLKIFEILIPYLLFLIILFLIIRSNNKLKNVQRYIKILILISLVGSLMWFLKVPVFRYGYSYFIIFISLIFAFSGNYISLKKNSDKIFRIVICILLLVFVLKTSIELFFRT